MTLVPFWTGVVPVVYLVSVPFVLVGAVVLVVALCRSAALGDAGLSEREVAAGQRPHGDVAVQPLELTPPWADLERILDEVELLNVVRGRDGLARPDLDRLDRAIARDLERGAR